MILERSTREGDYVDLAARQWWIDHGHEPADTYKALSYAQQRQHCWQTDLVPLRGSRKALMYGAHFGPYKYEHPLRVAEKFIAGLEDRWIESPTGVLYMRLRLRPYRGQHSDSGSFRGVLANLLGWRFGLYTNSERALERRLPDIVDHITAVWEGETLLLVAGRDEAVSSLISVL